MDSTDLTRDERAAMVRQSIKELKAQRFGAEINLRVNANLDGAEQTRNALATQVVKCDLGIKELEQMLTEILDDGD